MRLRHAFAVAALLSGCGDVSDNSNNIDAAIDAPDTAPPMILTSNPAKDAKKVSPLSPIVIRFDEAIDPASVTAGTITVKYGTLVGFYDTAGLLQFDNTGVVRGTATYDPEVHKIVFTPQFPLPATTRFDVLISGVKDMHGNTMADTHLAFDTIKNTARYTVGYSAAGAITGVIDFTGPVIKNGQQGLYASRAMGPDLIWFTADDLFSFYYLSEFNADETSKGGAIHGAGVDGKLGTSDDTTTGFYGLRWDGLAAKSMPISSAAGPDTIWGNTDDVFSSAYSITRMGDDFIAMIYYNQAGTDGIWLTPDDRSGSTFQKYVYDSMHVRTMVVSTSPGVDNLPFTADDTINSYAEYRYDAMGLMTHTINRNIGLNTVWFDSDDGYQSYQKFVRNTKGQITDRIGYNGIGVDNMWVSPDDVANSHFAMTYLPNGLVEHEIFYNAAGTDTLWGTPDDVIGSYLKRSYDTNGAQLSAITYDNPGPDGMWMMGNDDRVAGRQDFTIGY